MDAPERHVLIDLRALNATDYVKVLAALGFSGLSGATGIITDWDRIRCQWYWDTQWGEIEHYRPPYKLGTPGRDYEYIDGRELLWN